MGRRAGLRCSLDPLSLWLNGKHLSSVFALSYHLQKTELSCSWQGEQQVATASCSSLASPVPSQMSFSSEGNKGHLGPDRCLDLSELNSLWTNVKGTSGFTLRVSFPELFPPSHISTRKINSVALQERPTAVLLCGRLAEPLSQPEQLSSYLH